MNPPSLPHGFGCGVNNELFFLREEGYTFPATPDPCQRGTINNIHDTIDDSCLLRSHDTGERVKIGDQRVYGLIIIQDPLNFMKKSCNFSVLHRIENSDFRINSLPTRDCIDDCVNTGIHVKGRPEWVFGKGHTHGTQERDMDSLLGAPRCARPLNTSKRTPTMAKSGRFTRPVPARCATSSRRPSRANRAALASAAILLSRASPACLSARKLAFGAGRHPR